MDILNSELSDFNSYKDWSINFFDNSVHDLKERIITRSNIKTFETFQLMIKSVVDKIIKDNINGRNIIFFFQQFNSIKIIFDINKINKIVFIKTILDKNMSIQENNPPIIMNKIYNIKENKISKFNNFISEELNNNLFTENELLIIKEICFYDEKFIFPKMTIEFYKKMYNLDLNEEKISIIDNILEKINLFIKTNDIKTRKEFEDIFDLYHDELSNNIKPFKNFDKQENEIY